MSGSTFSNRAWAVFLLLSAASCTSTTTALAKRFSNQHSCQLDQVMVHEHGGNEYIAEGCGRRAKYVCPAFATMGREECAEEGQRPPGPVGLPERRPQIGVEDPPR